MTTNKKSVTKKARGSAKKARPTVKKKKVAKKKTRTVKNTPAKPAEKNRSTKPTIAKKESNLSLILEHPNPIVWRANLV